MHRNTIENLYSPDPTATAFAISDIKDVLWTVTDRCNLKCSYCSVVPHSGPPPPEPSREEIDHIIDQLETLPSLDSLILSGGEALISTHFEHILHRTPNLASVRYVITNGTTLNSRRQRLLLAHRPRVMISIDSMFECEMAQTRGPGVLPHAYRTLDWLLEHDFFTIVIIVLTRYNSLRIQDTLEKLYNIGIRNILIQQLHCSSASMKHFYLDASPSYEEIHRLALFLDAFRKQHKDTSIDDNEICFFEYRQREKDRKCDESETYYPQRLFRCGAGFNFFAIKTNGDIIPCNAFLDAVAGNLHTQTLDEILDRSPVMAGLRNLRSYRVSVIPGCASCGLNPICDGGCRADVFNLTGEIGDPHPYCARLHSPHQIRLRDRAQGADPSFLAWPLPERSNARRDR